jgi:DNA-binding transcriptional LysR family regulator
MELRQLRQFVAVAEARSFSIAAERLFMAQPPLSVAIRKLEQEIGTALFTREPRGVRMTPAGVAALEAATRCLREADRLAISAREADKGEAGELRIGFIGSVSYDVLPNLVQAFAARYPKVRLELREATNQLALKEVQSETMDLGIIRIPALPPVGVNLQVIGTDVFCVALPIGHRLAQKRSLRLIELADESFISYKPSQPGTALHAGMMQLFGRVGIAPKVAQEAVQVQTVVGLVASGLGVALVPSRHASHSTTRVAFLPLREPAQDATIGIALAYKASGELAVSLRFRELACKFSSRTDWKLESRARVPSHLPNPNA